jgi:hypothetical protein
MTTVVRCKMVYRGGRIRLIWMSNNGVSNGFICETYPYQVPAAEMEEAEVRWDMVD